MKKLSLNKILELNGVKQIEIPTPDNESEDMLAKSMVDEFRKKTSDKDSIEAARFVIGEMINNARYHGNRSDTSKKIILYFGWKEDDFYFVVEDEGEGFDIDNPVYHASPPDGGLGIAYSKQRALVYNFRDPRSYICLRVPKIEVEVAKK